MAEEGWVEIASDDDPEAEFGVFDVDDWLGKIPIENETDVEVDQQAVIDSLRRSPEVAAISQWMTNIHTVTEPSGRRKSSLVYRDKYVTPTKIFDQFAVAAHAAEYDDVVSGVLDSTESLAFSKVKFDAEDQDQEDLWNQLGKLWNLDSLLRKMWRELFVYSQVVVAMYPGTRNFNVRGRTDKGNKKRKTYKGVKVPVAFTIIDPMRVIPFGSLAFGQEKLAYISTSQAEVEAIDRVLANPNSTDPVKSMLIRKIGEDELPANMFSDVTDRFTPASRVCYEMNPKYVFRHTDTRSDYEKWAPLRLKSVFELLDLKAHLRHNDRTALIGAANYIILIKKGSDKFPARPQEVNALQGYARSLAKMPLLVGDHRLSVEIVTPPTDTTLKPERYNSLNSYITSRLYQLYSAGGYQSGAKGDSSANLTRMAARGLESRRHMLKRTFEAKVIDQIMQDNEDILDESPEMRFQPASIALEFDAARSAFMLELRNARELSRETLLTEFDFDQDDEARYLELEKEIYDDIFQTINPNNEGQPGSGTGPADNRTDGRSGGGNSNGGGRSAGKGAGQAPRNPARTSK